MAGIFGFRPNTALADTFLAPRQGSEAYWRAKLANQGSVSKARPSLAGKLENATAKALRPIVGDRNAARLGSKTFAALNDLTPVGNATMAADAGDAFRGGHPFQGAGLGALSVLPFARPAKGMFGRAFHGSPNALKIDALRASSGGELGPGAYFTLDRDLAAGYAIPSGEDAITPGMGVLDLDLEALNIAQIKRNDWLNERSAIMDSLRAANGGEWSGEFYGQSMKQIEDDLRALGFHGMYDDWRQGVVFPDFVDRAKVVGKSRR